MDVLGIIVAIISIWLVAKAFRLARMYQKWLAVPTWGLFGKYHWLLGNIPGVTGKNRLKHFYEDVPALNEKEHRLRRFMLGPVPIMVVSHPETVKLMLKSSTPKPPLTYGMLIPFIGEGLLISSGKKWARDRRLLTNAFHFNILLEYTPILQESCQVLIDKLHRHTQDPDTQSGAFNFTNACCLYSLDVMLRCTMGVESNCQLEDSEYSKGVRRITELIFARGTGTSCFLPDWLYFMTTDGAEMKSVCQMCQDFTSGIITDRKKKLLDDGLLKHDTPDAEEESQRKIVKGQLDFLDILLTVKDEDNTGMSEENIRDQVDTFLFEGHDTTSACMQWLVYFLAKHTDIQEKCRQEAQHFAGENGFVSHGNLGNLTYITQCIKEALRLASPVPAIERFTTEDTQIDDFIVPKGTMVNVNIFALHHFPDLYPDPFKFDPERFSEANCDRRHSHAFVAFSAGPRNCIGQVLAMNELRMATSSLVTHFQLKVDPTLPEPVFDDKVVMRADPGIYLLVTPL